MRKFLLASSACFVLVGGLALADPSNSNQTNPSYINNTSTAVSVPIVKNSLANGGSASATSGGVAATNGGTAVSVPLTNNSLANNGSSSATSGGTAVNAKLTDVANDPTLTDVGNTSLSLTRTDTRTDVTLAGASNVGTVGSTPTAVGPNLVGPGPVTPTGLETGALSMIAVNGGSGILTAQQNSGPDSLQQNSVALGSVVTGSSTGFNGF